MKIRASSGKLDTVKAEILTIAVFEDKKFSSQVKTLDKALGGLVNSFIKNKEFKAELNETFMFHTYERLSAKRILLVGMGKNKEFKADILRQVGGTAARYVRDLGLKTFVLAIPETKLSTEEAAQTLTEGVILGLYQFTDFITEEKEKIKKLKGFTLLGKGKTKIESGIKRGKIIADAQNFARTLSNEPSNVVNPKILAKKACELASKYNLKVKIFNKKEIKKLGMNAFLAVGSGSKNEPRLIVLEYNPKGKDTIVLVGKTITFDSGGLSLKPENKMDEMKGDKGGGATVLATLKAAAQLKLPQHIVGILPAAENLPSGSAYRPGDILKTCCNGKTIEVVNTDAEGRLTLADALAYSTNFKPKAIIDIATLTGSCVVALGYHAAGLLGNDKKLIEKIKKAGEKTHERVWELPLWNEYKEQIKSDIADVKNLGEGGAGTITAAALLSKFVEEYPWAHLDIAGPDWLEKPTAYAQKGGSGFGVRLLVQFLSDWKK